MSKIRVLVVDDSVVIRRVVSEVLGEQPDIEVAGTASNGQLALMRLTQLAPDLVILDVEMPEMDGLTALAKMRTSHPKLPVIMFSSLTERGARETLDALSLGAADYFPKPAGGLEDSRRVIREELVPAIRALCRRPPLSALTGGVKPAAAVAENAPGRPVPSRFGPPSRVDILAIGASTGGPNALAELFAALPAALPVPIVLVQHMPPVFTRLLAERLSKNSPIATVEAAAGDQLAPGRAMIAPGDHHLVIARDGAVHRARLSQEPPENSCRPAVDPLFRSVAGLFGAHCLAVVLTGMGQDGLRGCEAIAAAGGQIIVQDEATSVVWGMPGFVARAGLAERVMPLSMIAGEIVRRVRHGRG